MLSSVVLPLVVFLSISSLVASVNEEEKTASYWERVGEHEMEMALGKAELIKRRAKNAILFIGDGLGVSTITAGRILKGQLAGGSGEEHMLAMDTLPYTGKSKTYSVSSQTADSTSTATAFMSGVKTNNWVIGLSATVNRMNCEASLQEENILSNWIREAKEQGKSVGVVTTTAINHGTPAAAYAHSPFRFWADDSGIPPPFQAMGCKDISLQMYESRHDFEVLLGGGRRHFRHVNATDEDGSPGRRMDGRDLIAEWIEDMGDQGRYVSNKTQLDDVDVENTDYLLGMFGYNHMNYETDRNPEEEPSITEMTEKAIQILSKNPNGYALLVEGGRIDQAHHGNNAYRALHDTIAFDDAIQFAMDATEENDTLLMVTADHGNVMTLGGYSDRGTPILGLTTEDGEIKQAMDGANYTVLMYTNGNIPSGASDEDEDGEDSCDHMWREDMDEEQAGDIDYVQQALVPLRFGSTHGGEDVSVMARGPYSYLVTGVNEQTHIANVIRYALCVGKYSGDACPHKEEEEEETVELDNTVTNVASFLGHYFSAISGIFKAIAGGNDDTPTPEPDAEPEPTYSTPSSPTVTFDYSSFYDAIYRQFSGFYRGGRQSLPNHNEELD